MRLLAELIENATQASPPTNDVSVRGFDVANGFVIEVEDSGLGLGKRALADANALLADPPELDLAKRTELGLFVVGTLAKRHGVKVRLRESPYGGITAIVLLGRTILTEGPAIRGNEEEQREGSAEGPPAAETRPSVWAPPEQPALERGSAHRSGTAPAPPRPEGVPGGRLPDTGGRLPRRVRQANLVPQLQDAPEETATGPAEPQERSPEQTRSMMSALQSGWTRGRNEEPDQQHPTGDPPSQKEHDNAGGDQ
ncbi:ATP-binding protein [Allosalinactinospora lopnorensis]|uniref:ATP-binding protein n=1 Tax=Allosalinactinospora lopnorensis TaxID=1352348 RepID=UPI00308423E2